MAYRTMLHERGAVDYSTQVGRSRPKKVQDTGVLTFLKQIKSIN